MTIARTTRLILTFYSGFAIASCGITVAAGGLFAAYGLSMIAALFWLKVITNAVLWYFINQLKRKEYYYYHNLGLSKKVLWGSALTIDFSLFFLTLIALYHCL